MPKAKYAEIYKDLKRKIETGEYEFQELLPSENTLVQEYDCSRNTIRRAIGDLVADGYVQTMQGKGVRIIFQPALQTSFTIGLIETFTESAKRNNQKSKTKVIHFAELVVDKKIAAKTGFNIGDEIYYLQRLHYLDGKALILNHNYFLKSVAKDLTIEIAEKSIYDYLENTLGVSIVTSKRIITVEDGTIEGGLGSAVMEFMAENNYTPQIKRIGIPDRFIEQGSISELYTLCGMDEASIVKMLLDK